MSNNIGRDFVARWWVACSMLGAVGMIGCSASAVAGGGEAVGTTASALVTPPPTPTGLAPSGAATISQAFTWTGDPSATSYQLYIAGVTNTTYTTATLGCPSGGTCTTPAITLTAGSNYTWYVAGINTAGESAFASAAISVPSPTMPPATPTGLAPSGAATTSQAFTWTGDPNATSYQLYIAGVINTTYTTATLGCVAGGTCTTPGVSLVGGSNYTWWVAGINAAGEGVYANAAITVSGTSVPLVPTGLAPSGAATTSQAFTWTGDPNATSYQLYIHGVTNTTYTTAALGCAAGGTCTTPALSLQSGSSYTWYVAGINATGESAYANAAITVSGASVPLVPTGLAPSGAATTSQAFTWTGDPNATSYQLYIPGVTNTTYTTTTLSCVAGGTCTTPAVSLPSGDSLTWYVAGINATGESAYANAAITVSGTAVPPEPTALAPSGAATTSQVFTWTGDPSASSYQLYIAGVTNTTYTTTVLGCASGGTCTTPAVTLPGGSNLTWYVAGIDATGTGTYADAAISTP